MDAHRILAKAQRVVFWVLLVLLALMALAQLVGPAQAATNNVPYDADKRQKLETMVKLYADTRNCMYNGSRAMLRQGVRDQHAITVFTIGVCSSALRGHLLNKMGWSLNDTSKLITTIAALELDAAAFTV